MSGNQIAEYLAYIVTVTDDEKQRIEQAMVDAVFERFGDNIDRAKDIMKADVQTNESFIETHFDSLTAAECAQLPQDQIDHGVNLVLNIRYSKRLIELIEVRLNAVVI